MNPFGPKFFTRKIENTYTFGRTILAFAQLSVLLLTPAWALTVPVGGGAEPSCSGAFTISAYCIGGGSPTGFSTGRVISIVILLLVALGWRPRWTAVPHAWVTISFLHATSLPDGGEAVLAATTILLIPLCLADGRKWSWPARLEPGSREPLKRSDGIAAAIQWVLRSQIAGIYLHSALAKLGVADWINGSAMFYISRQHFFGATGFVGDLLKSVTNVPLGTAALTWGTIIIEVLIAVLILGTTPLRRVSVILAIVLHVGIIIALGLWSFGLIMCGAVIIAASLPVSSIHTRRTPHDQDDVRVEELPNKRPVAQ
ncbi:sporulation-delaying protein SdpB family protein [Mycetocola sp. BIGb0189]|uniref:sporulation-delaying protein SdpB family protein n=1 Tax=Mycetocola sp. BIGb0189 TaxID=2940604 RepID=UPI00216A59A4|nr:sporulation-delaying protein SdpB family protein [Mycetocola sp. BIGb0189]